MSTELFGKIKALIVSKGGTADTESAGMTSDEVKQYVEIAHLYYGVAPTDALATLAFPEHVPPLLQEALEGTSAGDVSVADPDPDFGDDTIAVSGDASDDTGAADLSEEPEEDPAQSEALAEDIPADTGNDAGEDEVTEGEEPTIPEANADQPTE